MDNFISKDEFVVALRKIGIEEGIYSDEDLDFLFKSFEQQETTDGNMISITKKFAYAKS